MKNETARKRLARIRCLLDTIKRMEQGEPLPLALCYVPGEIVYGASSETTSDTIPIPVLRKPSKDAEKLGEIYLSAGIEVIASGDEYNNKYGRWIKLTQKSLQKFCTTFTKAVKEGWVLHIPCDPKQGPGKECLTPLPNKTQSSLKKASGSKGRTFSSWMEAVEASYTIQLTQPPVIDKYGDKEAMKELCTPPPKWNLDADEELAKFLTNHVNKHETSLGNISRFVEDIDVSSESDTKNNLTDGDPDSFWESDGSQGRHWIKLTIKPGTVIRKLFIGVDARDDNYMPYKIFVYGGETGSMKLLNEVYIDLNFTGDALILESMTQYFHIIDIRIKECKDDGIDTRIHSVKIVSASEKEPGLSIDVLSSAQLVRFPKLDAVDIPLLYRRAQVLQRFIDLLDSVIHYLLPSWNYTVGSFNDLEAIRQLLPLSRYRNNLLEKFLKESQTGPPPRMPKLFINRRLAAEHRADPSQDPEGKSTIFHQLYEGLQQERCGVKLDYRWPGRYDQWWECKFLSEGIIDQGGGFRDSLADMAEELCPSSMDDPMPLNYFVRTPNQLQDSSSVNRDSYIPSPSCKEFSKLEWLGMIMGACLRSGREHLVVSLPSFVWKPLVGERVTWSRDFHTVDLAQVKLLERLQTVDKETFDTRFGGVLTFTTVLSDDSLVNLVPGGSERFVEYEEKELYSKLVQKHRMNESKQQIDAIRRGLLKVVPQAVLDLLTWQELERRICGDPEITVEALKKCSHYEDLSADNDQRVKDLWLALENFTNEDRSRFLRFVTGRRRLPAPLFICPGRSNAEDDSLPEAATCSSTLFLPKYSSPKVAEEKIRYAAYNCVAIDTDVSPWEE